jgi:hypothetical protein
VNGWEDRGGVDALIEGEEDARASGGGGVARGRGRQRRRRGREAEVDGLAELAAAGRGGAGGRRDAVLGGHGEATGRAKQQGAGADPGPCAGRLRAELDRHLARRELALRGEGDHRLREGEREVGGDRDLAVGAVAQQLERAGGGDGGGALGLAGEGGEHGGAGPRRRLRGGAQREVGGLGGVEREGGEAGEQGLDLALAERRGGGERRRGGGAVARLALGEGELEARERGSDRGVVVDDVAAAAIIGVGALDGLLTRGAAGEEEAEAGDD